MSLFSDGTPPGLACSKSTKISSWIQCLIVNNPSGSSKQNNNTKINEQSLMNGKNNTTNVTSTDMNNQKMSTTALLNSYSVSFVLVVYWYFIFIVMSIGKSHITNDSELNFASALFSWFHIQYLGVRGQSFRSKWQLTSKNGLIHIRYEKLGLN